MKLRSALIYTGWPVISGVLLALVILLGIHAWQGGISLPALSNVQPTASPTTVDTTMPPVLEEQPSDVVSYSSAVKKAAPSVVNIRTAAVLTEQPSRLEREFAQLFNRSPRMRQLLRESLGSGVIVSPDGYILTNYHVISGSDAIVVSLNDGREADAKIIGYDQNFDLAVIKIELGGLTPISAIRVSKDLDVGDVVLAIGNPFGYGQTVTQGIISATGRIDANYNSYIQTDAAINQGNSGGALIDAYGNLVGIISRVSANNSTGIGFAIPADLAAKVLSELKEFGRVIRGWLGIDGGPLAPEVAESLGVNGIFVAGVFNNGPAQKAGLLPRDIIVRVNDQEISNGNFLRTQIERTTPGEKVKITVWRNGETINLDAIVGERPKNQSP